MGTKIKKTDFRLLICVFVAGIFVFGLLWAPAAPVNAISEVGLKPTPKPKKSKFSEFPHDQKAHKMECSACHKFPTENWNKVRTGDKAFADQTDYPKHDSCVKCHMQQFFKGSTPKICSICHTNPSPRDGNRFPFPNPREIYDQSPKSKDHVSDFLVGFPHDKHIEIVSSLSSRNTPFVNASFSRGDRKRAGEESCSVCHKTANPLGDSKDEYLTPAPAKLGDAFWLKKGTFKTAPTGHTTCFTCHNADMGILPAPQTCSACHHLKPAMPSADFDPALAATMAIPDKVTKDTWARRHSAGTFPHEHFAHGELSCSTCHNVLTMNTADPATQKVSVSACATCHATPTTDDGGVLNFEVDSRKKAATFQCTKCHVTFGKLPVPESHTKAIVAAGGK
ncbi:hypothetical protein BH10ACI2_BH10ACI2_07300 [soil metagenome]